MLRFVLVLGACMGAFNVLFFLWIAPSDLFQTYLKLNAQASVTVLQILGDDATAIGTLISSPRYSIDVKRGCEAIQVSAFFVFVILAWPLPVSVRQRMAGWVIGVLLLLTLNLVRLVSLYYTGVYFPSAFEAMHIDVWQPAFIVLALLFWLIWVWWTSRPDAEPAHAHA